MTIHESDSVQFDPGDFEVLDIVSRLDPQLRVCAWAIKRARLVELAYPVEKAEALQALLEGEFFEGEGYLIRREEITRYMHDGFFPIRSEEELVSRVYVTLMSCRSDSGLRAVAESIGSGRHGASFITRASSASTGRE